MMIELAAARWPTMDGVLVAVKTPVAGVVVVVLP